MIHEFKDYITGKVLWSGEAATLQDALKAAIKDKAYLSGANLSRADLSRANLSGAYLSGANLSGANLSRADLSRAYLSRADLSGANLSGANLSGANLSRAYLSGANLSRADLSRANLSGAYLSGANLSRAYLSGANLSGAKGFDPRLCTSLLILKDQPGAIRAYKLVDADEGSPIAAKQGFVNSDERIFYRNGETVEEANANTDPNQHCGGGINVATLEWIMREWQEGMRIKLVEFTAADIACIPTSTDGKFRLYRCTVVGEKDPAEFGLGVKKEEAKAEAKA